MSTMAVKSGLADSLSMLERVLRDGRELAPEYPLVFHPDGPGGVVSLRDEDGVTSACTVLTRDLVSPRGSLRVGLIGSVATAPEHRGQGLATQVLRAAEGELRRLGATLALLWADDPGFYLRRGWRPVGRELLLPLARELTDSLPAHEGVREARPGEYEALLPLYLAHEQRSERTASEMAHALACPRMRTLVLEREGELVAYACRGRGEDMQVAIHEWGGAPEDVLPLLRAHLVQAEEAEGGLVALAPWPSEGLVSALAAYGVEPTGGMLALGKPLHRGRLAEVLSARLAPHGRIEAHRDPDRGESGLRLVGPTGASELPDDVLLSMALGTLELQEDLESMGEAFGLDLAQLLPLEHYVWGLDSI